MWTWLYGWRTTVIEGQRKKNTTQPNDCVAYSVANEFWVDFVPGLSNAASAREHSVLFYIFWRTTWTAPFTRPVPYAQLLAAGVGRWMYSFLAVKWTSNASDLDEHQKVRQFSPSETETCQRKGKDTQLSTPSITFLNNYQIKQQRNVANGLYLYGLCL